MGPTKKSSRKKLVILFADLVDYTAMVRQNETDALSKRQRFENLAVSINQQFEGRIIQFLGDGVLSIFENPIQSLHAAMQMQINLLKTPPVYLRIGIHIGEVLLEGDNIFGDAVNIASRIESFAAGGSILVSETLYNETRKSNAYKFTDLGLVKFKNVDEPFKLFALDSKDIVVPSRENLSGKGNLYHDRQVIHLPKTTAPIFGRNQAIAQIAKLFKENAIITITGPGGIGKTRLAQDTAQKSIHFFDDGAYWVSLSSINRKSQFPFALAKSLSLAQDPTSHTIQQIVGFIAKKKVLLILDNFEHVIDAAPYVETLVSHCPNLRVLITSRIILNLMGEQEYLVGPLDIPTRQKDKSPDELEHFDSIKLFCDRAKKINPQFKLTASNGPFIAKICAKLEGLPLAIELAAARIKLFSPRELLDKLDRSLDFLKSNQLNRPERHHTLRQTIQWSYDLLPVSEKKLFHRISIFRGGASLDAAEKICPKKIQNSTSVLDDLMALANKSLIKITYEKERGSRLTMLDTIRAFGLECLKNSDEEFEVRMLHLEYFLEKAENATPHLTGPAASEWFSLLETDLDNFRKAMDWSFKQGMLDKTFRMGIALWRLWYTRGMLSEAMNFAIQLLKVGKGEEFDEYRVQVMETLGVAYFYTSEYIKAIPLFEESLDYWQQQNNQEKTATILNHLGFTFINTGKVDRGIELSNQAFEIWLNLGDQRGQSVSYNNLGWAYVYLGRPVTASEYFRRGLTVRKAIRDERGEVFLRINLAWALGYTSQKAKALDLLNKCFSELEKIDDRIVLSWGCFIKAQIEFEMTRFAECSKSLEKAEELTLRSSIRHVDGWGKYLKGLLETRNGNFASSREFVLDGIRIFEQNGNIFYLARGWYNLAYISLVSEDFRNALENILKCLKINHTINSVKVEAESLELAAIVFAKLNDLDRAAKYLAKSTRIREEIQSPTPKLLEDAYDLAISAISLGGYDLNDQDGNQFTGQECMNELHELLIKGKNQ